MIVDPEEKKDALQNLDEGEDRESGKSIQRKFDNRIELILFQAETYITESKPTGYTNLAFADPYDIVKNGDYIYSLSI